jgi:hypothetical protein
MRLLKKHPSGHGYEVLDTSKTHLSHENSNESEQENQNGTTDGQNNGHHGYDAIDHINRGVVISRCIRHGCLSLNG